VGQYPASELNDSMNKYGIIKILKKECEKVVECEKRDEKEKSEEKDTVILAYSLIMRNERMESSLLKEIAEYLTKIIKHCLVDSFLLNVGMKAAVAHNNILYCLFVSLSFCYSISSSSFYSQFIYHHQNTMI
jgi:hypothetical protein